MTARQHNDHVIENLTELKEKGELSLRLLPPPGLSTIEPAGNTMEVYLDFSDTPVATFENIKKLFYDDLVEQFDFETIKFAETL